ncbi:hypothetical protein Hdeb2414_s0051g00751621 [Helianthus debilis subsp. tardiflorus]
MGSGETPPPTPRPLITPPPPFLTQVQPTPLREPPPPPLTGDGASMSQERERPERQERKREREPAHTAAMESGGSGVRRWRQRWSETQTGSLCLEPVVCVSDRWFVSRSGSRCLDPVVRVFVRRVSPVLGSTRFWFGSHVGLEFHRSVGFVCSGAVIGSGNSV